MVSYILFYGFHNEFSRRLVLYFGFLKALQQKIQHKAFVKGTTSMNT